MSNWVYRRPTHPRTMQRLATVPVFFAEPLGAMSGAATLSVGTSAAIASLQAITGAATLTIAETAAAGVYMTTTGAATLTIGETGGLDAFVYGDIAGSAFITFGETGGMDAFSWGNLIANEVIAFGSVAKLADASTELPQPVLPLLRPTFKSVDGKTLADGFNRGLVDTPDYEWPNTRKFYQ